MIIKVAPKVIDKLIGKFEEIGCSISKMRWIYLDRELVNIRATGYFSEFDGIICLS